MRWPFLNRSRRAALCWVCYARAGRRAEGITTMCASCTNEVRTNAYRQSRFTYSATTSTPGGR